MSNGLVRLIAAVMAFGSVATVVPAVAQCLEDRPVASSATETPATIAEAPKVNQPGS